MSVVSHRSLFTDRPGLPSVPKKRVQQHSGVYQMYGLCARTCDTGNRRRKCVNMRLQFKGSEHAGYNRQRLRVSIGLWSEWSWQQRQCNEGASLWAVPVISVQPDNWVHVQRLCAQGTRLSRVPPQRLHVSTSDRIGVGAQLHVSTRQCRRGWRVHRLHDSRPSEQVRRRRQHPGGIQSVRSSLSWAGGGSPATRVVVPLWQQRVEHILHV